MADTKQQRMRTAAVTQVMSVGLQRASLEDSPGFQSGDSAAGCVGGGQGSVDGPLGWPEAIMTPSPAPMWAESARIGMMPWRSQARMILCMGAAVRHAVLPGRVGRATRSSQAVFVTTCTFTPRWWLAS